MVLSEKQTHRSMKQNTSPRQIHAPMVNYSMTKEARIYNREKRASSVSDVGKTGQLHVKPYTKIN